MDKGREYDEKGEKERKRNIQSDNSEVRKYINKTRRLWTRETRESLAVL